MKKVKCVSIRPQFPKQVKIGNEYWIDEHSIFSMNNETFAAVYSDNEVSAETFIATMRLEHFEDVNE